MAITSSPNTPRSFLELLDEQYAAVEEYANAQTLLYNASTKSNATAARLGEFDGALSPLMRAVKGLEVAKEKVRSSFENLIDRVGDGLSEEGRKRRSDHLALSQRVVCTLASNPSWHANGLPNDAGRDASETLQANTVAVASLNASIARIKDIEDFST